MRLSKFAAALVSAVTLALTVIATPLEPPDTALLRLGGAGIVATAVALP